MCKGKKEFLISLEDTINLFEEWGVHLLEEVKNLSVNTSYDDFRKIEDEVNNYKAMGRLLSIKANNNSYNYTRIPLHFKEVCDKIYTKDLGVLIVADKLRLTDDIREIFVG